VEERNPIPEPETAVTVLGVSPHDCDHEALADIFRHSKWSVLPKHTYAEAIALLKRRPVSVIVCERELPDGTWEDILEGAMAAESQPSLIVTSRLADERLWCDVLSRGGYNVLMKPFHPAEVLRDVYLAWHDWKARRHDVRRRRPRVAGGGAA